LENLLKAVEKARPKQVGYKRVITRKTEKKIQSLKESLINIGQMSEASFAEILQKEVHGRQPKYIDAKNFITQEEARDIIHRMLDEAEIQETTQSYNRAVENDPEIVQQTERLDKKIAEQPKRDPHSLESMRYYHQQAEIKTGAPFYSVYMSLLDTHLENHKTRTATLMSLQETVGKDTFRQITRDKAAVKRITDYIASQSTLKEKPAYPTEITDDEIKIAQRIQEILKDKQNQARWVRFYWWYRTGRQDGPYPMGDYDANKAAINKGVDIYESKGKEAVRKYLDTQEWGVIKSGYEPLRNILPKVKVYQPKPATVGKSHIQIRTDIEYHEQEKDIFQRLASYLRQLDLLYMSPKINAYVRLWDDNLQHFNNPNRVKENVELFLCNLKRYNIQGGFFEQMVARLYAQAMRTIIMPSPVLSIMRNLLVGQNWAFEHDKTILLDPRNKHLTSEELEYLETYVIQQRQMIEEYFMVGEKPLPGLKTLTALVDKVKLYPWSDTKNRQWSFWAKINQVKRAQENRSVAEILKDIKFTDLSLLEQKMALGILARDGQEAFARYVSRTHVDDIHFLYERSQRSPAEMSPLGKVMGNLMLFPRAYTEKLVRQTGKLFDAKAQAAERLRALKVLFAVIAGGLATGTIYTLITGRKRNPYNPLQILAYTPGGLAWGTVESASDVANAMLLAASGDAKALERAAVALPKAADMFIPFYDYTLRGIEAATDQKNIDRKAIRKIREMIDNEYKVRGGAYKVKRNALEKWQYFLAGAGVDQKIKERQPKGRTSLGRGINRGVGRRGVQR
jgi:hypothetical protein